MTRRTLTATIALAAVLAFPAAALCATQTAHGGAVVATFSYDTSGSGYTNLHLTISRAGQVAFDAPVTSRLCTPFCGPLDTGPGQSSVRVLALEQGTEPAVVLSLFTGSAHCCVIEQIYTYAAATASYTKAEHDFANAGASLEDLGHNGIFEFASSDNDFYYQFTSYAASGSPVQIWAFRGGRFVDVTRRYPKQIRADAAQWWYIFSKHLDDGEGLIAAWAADQDLLGNQALVKRRLATEARQGHLRSDLPGEPTGQAFVTELQRFLRKRGYTR